MSLVRTAPRLPPFAFLRELLTGAAAGTAVGVPVGLLFAALRFPSWAETLTSVAFVFGVMLVPAVVFRLLLHGLNAYMDSGMRDLDPDLRPLDVGHSSWPVVGTTGLLVTWLWLVLASGLSTGDWAP